MSSLQTTAILVAIVWVFPAIALFVAIQFNHHGSPIRFKLATARVFFVLSVSVLCVESFALSQTPHRLHALEYAALGLWLMQTVLWGFMCWMVSCYSRKEDRAQGLIAGGPKAFFWQGLLILLPVAAMAMVGLFSLRQDRLLADRDAVEFGASLARHLAKSVGDEVQSQLQEYRESVFSFQANRGEALTLSQWATSADRGLIAKQIADWQQAHPEIDLSAAPVVDGGIRLDGRLRNELLPPTPPEWVYELTPEQEHLWHQAQETEFVAGNLQAAQTNLEQFIATKPPTAARANAEFLLLRLKASRLAPVPAAEVFAASKWANSPELTEAGLPVGQLICYQALRLTPDHAGLDNQFVQKIAWAINYRPSILSSRVVAEVERVAGPPDSESAKGAAALRGWWEAEQSAREVLEDFRGEYPASSWTNGVYWANSGGNEFLLTLELNDGPTTIHSASGTTIATNLPPAARVRVFPKQVVVMALKRGIAKADASIHGYAEAQFEIGGAEFDANGVEQTQKSSAAAWPLLGEAEGRIELLPRLMSATGFPFRARVFLAHPDVLYSRQHYRTLLFGGLILASALAALIGFLAARRAFYRQLRLNEMKSNFVSSVSHELRAPIASVRLMAEGLERGRITGEKQHDYFKFIVQECRRLSSLIENVLDFSRIEQGRKQYEMESTDLAALAQQTVKLMETYAAEREIGLTFNLTGAPVPVEADGKAMQQALINLIDNALKHSPKASTISVGLDFSKCGVRSAECGMEKSPAGTVALWVEDRGEGIPAVEHEKIFERFYRVGSELRRETQGVGIGLSIVKHIVEAHGGRVIVRSAPGQGSRFTIEMPANGSSVK